MVPSFPVLPPTVAIRTARIGRDASKRILNVVHLFSGPSISYSFKEVAGHEVAVRHFSKGRGTLLHSISSPCGDPENKFVGRSSLEKI